MSVPSDPATTDLYQTARTTPGRQASDRLLFVAEPAPVAEGAAEAAAEGDAAAEAAPPAEDAQEGEEEEGGSAKPDYSKNMLEYVVASSGQVSLPAHAWGTLRAPKTSRHECDKPQLILIA